MFNLDSDCEYKDKGVQNLQDFLVDTLGHVRSLHAALTAMMADMAALRKTVLAEPQAMERYEKHLKVAVETAKPLVDEALHSYDEMIQVLSISERWQN